MGRSDGILVKDEVPMYYLIPHFLTERNDAMNMITIDIPIEPLRAYMNAKRREGKTVSHMALIMAAYAHMAGEFPSVNRFIVNRRIYQRNEFKISLVVLRPGGANDDTMSSSISVPGTACSMCRRKSTTISRSTPPARRRPGWIRRWAFSAA